MAVTAALMSVTPNRLRYLITQDGAAGTTVNITCSGGATPDTRTDSVAGPIKALSRASADGFGQIPAGVISAAQASALWESNNTIATGGALVGTVPGLKTAKLSIITRSGAAAEWRVAASTNLADAIIVVTAQAGAGTAILDIIVDMQS